MSKRPYHFNVSSGLKTVLGSELITDDEVAVFELVKNSFDARAKHVEIFFGNNTIVIADDGSGMSLDDLKHKWLFVAYSAKRDATPDRDFRQEIAQRHYAGSKGIGRFSSDRLGRLTTLQTRASDELDGPIHEITVDWGLFDENHKKLFQNIDVQHTHRAQFDLPKELRKIRHGTVITITDTRKVWDRQGILTLKSALAKLINPFGSSVDGFSISIVAPAELEADDAEKEEWTTKDDQLPPNSTVNGEVGNFVFNTLKEKTTFVDVKISDDGQDIESELTDRGELIYRIRERNPYDLLRRSGFKCQVYFLNTSAKLTFARRMGVPSVQFGSVFLFRNGFRVFPIGEEGDDWFRMDRRKQQGYARFLGTRDVIGRIEVSGASFQEPSSRNTGLIENEATEQLRACFSEFCLKRLERYVVPVTFVDSEDKNTEDISRLMTDPGRARVAAVVAKLVDHDGAELLEYSKRLIRILSERSEQFESSLASFRAIAEHTKDSRLFNQIEEAEKKFERLRRAEESARKQADQERAAKEAAEARASHAEEVAQRATLDLHEERKRNVFLASMANLDTETIVNLHHQITIYAVNIQHQIQNFLARTSAEKSTTVAQALETMESISLLNLKILGIAKFATKANFRLESEAIQGDLGEYIRQYVEEVAQLFLQEPVTLLVEHDGKGFVQSFKPIDISVVIDNLVANAKKARATEVRFVITHPARHTIHVLVHDNGRGFDKRITDLDRVFEKGFTTTDGSGLGLFHVKQVLGEMKGTIEARKTNSQGAEFLIRIAK